MAAVLLRDLDIYLAWAKRSEPIIFQENDHAFDTKNFIACSTINPSFD